MVRKGKRKLIGKRKKEKTRAPGEVTPKDKKTYVRAHRRIKNKVGITKGGEDGNFHTMEIPPETPVEPRDNQHAAEMCSPDESDGHFQAEEEVKARKKKQKKIILRKYSTQDLNRALVSIASKRCSYRTASKKFGVPYQTLFRRLKHHPKLGDLKRGPQPQVPKEVEEEIVNYIVTSARIGFGLTRAEICLVTKDILDELEISTSFKDNLPSDSWIYRFMLRHPLLINKSQEHHSAGRSEVTIHSVKCWFANVEKRLRVANLGNLLMDPRKIYNMDESSFAFNYTTRKVVGVVGETTQRLVQGNEKECCTVALCYNAIGQAVPPFIVHAGKQLRVLPEHKGLGVWRSVTESGWMTAKAMLEFCQKLARHLADQGLLTPGSNDQRVLLFLDGQASHFSYSVLKFCESAGIELIRFYPNSTHLIQPADCSVMKCAKGFWEQLLIDSRTGRTQADFSCKKNFPLAVDKIAKYLDGKSELMRKSFEKTGIYPFNSAAPDYNLLLSEQRRKIDSSFGLQYDSNYWDEEVGDTSVELDPQSGLFVVRRNEHALEDLAFESLIEEQPVEGLLNETTEILDERTGLFVPRPLFDHEEDSLMDLDDLVREEFRKTILSDNTNLAKADSAATVLKKKLKDRVTVKKTTRRKLRRRIEYHVTSKENITLQENETGRGGDEDWQCHHCQFFYSEETKNKKKQLPWVTCDSCPLKFHIKCVKKAHASVWKLAFNSKTFDDFDFECENCCAKSGSKKCCK